MLRLRRRARADPHRRERRGRAERPRERRAIGVDAEARGGAGDVRAVTVAVHRIGIGRPRRAAGVGIAREVPAADDLRGRDRSAPGGAHDV